MLCSLPPPGKSASNWLHRLRSNKGFPIADDLGLDHFLTNQNQNQNHPSPLPHSNPIPIPNSTSSNSPSQNRIITGILSDLFNINANSSSSSKKFPRKQSNPKICSVPSLSSAAHNQDSILSSNSDNSSKGEQPHPQNARANLVNKLEDHNADKELIGYSKSEVTVIDTSCDVWKSDKLIFRRKNVWKVKDKKGKLRNYGRKKKRKLSSETTNNNHLPDRMIASPPTKKTKLCRASGHRWKESLNPFNKGCNPQHCSGPEISANAPDSSNDQIKNVHSLSQRNGSYDPEKSDHPRA